MRGSAEKPPGSPNSIWDNRARSTWRARKADPAKREKKWLTAERVTFGTSETSGHEPAGSAEISTSSPKKKWDKRAKKTRIGRTGRNGNKQSKGIRDIWDKWTRTGR
ncbi:hypothetical protein KI387_000997, partial [Taxus chinensis]